ncbi:MAG TPA: 50S ribosomal protein L5 [Methanothermobacter sp.]|jgi:large subunit ribosomal protein L5|uniref:Large ribosomal subunit protein uL5 n=1 Tax=Methanothermobacter tenebrarum TaxID=680118 RepID=A0ABN6PGI6_9EURY|nr:50S ribosomal protein L5 [Methanothermobacter tenebrarum]MDD3454627.1 50S ribosomal protein L5 [Methanobacteriales archaeon]MDI6881470.1 50S ribosomal protein L5 [Methanothermobacter sp.]MDX9692931.1 50S ribosomal protein L5 [Methanothermobacter sp.]BDH79746.1 50S ribosomal protein L5 [Methanothermobacter tenebrarum]HHW16613.1 50S ribosomal protein L5 [Methanothermobacter sp.]
MNPMERVRIAKATLNIGVGEGGERLARAEKLLETMTGQKPVKTISKVTNPEFGIRKKQPIGCKVTLRGEKAEEIIRKFLDGIGNKIKASQFDDQGNVSMGIEEHIDMPGMKYDPDIGIFGMDLSITFEKPGYRISRRRIQKRKVPRKHRVTREEAIKFMKEKFNVKIT